ncbi:MAG: hypothetical protein M9938_02275 [Solirubrobacterales bacterium]|nr:hypothetical protein [Solirubrobacterales bacterium]
MSVNCVQLGEGERHQAPVENGPVAEILVADQPGRQMGVVEVTVPCCGQMGLHDHGESESLLVPLHGAIRLISEDGDGDVTVLEPGKIVTIPAREKVRLDNPEHGEGRLLVVFSPAGFTNQVASWPPAEAKAPAAAA